MNREALEIFLVKGLIPTGREVGRGAFGRVEEVRIPGALCAAKSIHSELLRTGDITDLTSKFVRECQLMSNLRHPHIVQFLGICYLPDSSDIPALVMEKLDCDLHQLLDTVRHVPLAVKKSILTDVANGLVYLHCQKLPIVHRDLTARNVLLNSALTAKIGDLGVARIVNLSPGQLAATMSKVPGNFVYMAPEAMEDHPRYNTSLDIFSFGNLVLFTLTQVFPNLKAATYIEKRTKTLCPRTEIDRRIESFIQLERKLGDKNHDFVTLAKQCLQNVPEVRPSAGDVVLSLERMVLVPYRLWDFNKIEMIQEVLRSEARGRKTRWTMMHREEDQQEEKDRRTPSEHIPLRQQVQHQISHLDLSLTLRPHQIVQDNIKSITWRKAKRMPKRLEFAQSVVLNGNVYIGSEKSVLSYSVDHDEWSELPKPPQKDFSMAVLNDELLVLVGGLEIHGILFAENVSDKLTVWDSENRKWTHPFPNMPVARYSVSSVGYKSCLILAGGRQLMPQDTNLVTSHIEVPSLSAVEIFNSSNLKWYQGDPLPLECHAMQSSVIGDTLYVVGGQNRFDHIKTVLWTHLPDLISSTRQISPGSASTVEDKTYSWNVLPPCPRFASSIPFCFSSTSAEITAGRSYGIDVPLLVLGGLTGLQLSLLGELDTTGIVKDINTYSPSTNQWIKVGELPEACVGCSCSLLPTGELFVAGGGRFRSPLNSVYYGKFEYNV